MLSIEADNSSLAQILAAITQRTGMKVVGLAGDQRVFGKYGPDTAIRTLRALLDGSSYNYVILGGDATHPPRELVLTGANGAPTPESVPGPTPAANAPPPAGPATPPNGPMTAQQMLEQYRRAHPVQPPAQQEEEGQPHNFPE